MPWSHPAIVFPAVWCMAMLVPLACAPEYNVWIPGLLVTALLVAVFSFAALFGAKAVQPREPVVPRLSVLRAGVMLGSIVGLGAVAALFAGSDAPEEWWTVSGWTAMAARFAVARYQQEYVEPLAGRLCSIGFYLASLLGGMLVAYSPRWRDRMLAALPTVVAVVYGAILTARAPFLMTGVMSVSAFVAVRTLTGRGRPMVSRRALLTIGGTGLGMLMLFVLLQLARAGRDDLGELGETLEHLRIWFFGHTAAWTLWLKGNLHDNAPLRLGERTFAGIFDFFGLGERRQGIYETIAIGNGQESNIFTALRSLIEDAGLLGAFGVTAVSGLVAGHTYAAVSNGHNSHVPVLAAAYCYILWSPITSFFAYNTLIVALLGFAVVTQLPWALANRQTTSSPSTYRSRSPS